MKYSNLIELLRYHPYDISTFANFADVSTETMRKIKSGEQEARFETIYKISHFTNIPYSVLSCEKLIYLETENRKHQQMIEELENNLCKIYVSYKFGSHEAADYMKYHRVSFVNMRSDFKNKKKVSYIRYLSEKESQEDTLLFIKNEKRKKKLQDGTPQSFSGWLSKNNLLTL